MTKIQLFKNKRVITMLLIALLITAIASIVLLYKQVQDDSESGFGITSVFRFRTPSFLYSMYGEGEGELLEPVAVAVAPDNSVWVADVKARDIKVYDEDGRFKFKFNSTPDGPLKAPVGMAVDGQRVLVSDSSLNQIYEFNLKGQYLNSFIPDETRNRLKALVPCGIEIVNNAVYFTDILHHRLVITDLKGDLVKTVGGPGEGEGRLAYPHDVAVDSEGKIYISDSNNFRVQVSDDGKNFQILRNRSAGSSAPAVGSLVRGISVDLNGYLWIVDALNHKVRILNKEGETIHTLGESDSEFDESLSYPNGIDIRNDRIYVADKGNARIQVFEQ